MHREFERIASIPLSKFEVEFNKYWRRLCKLKSKKKSNLLESAETKMVGCKTEKEKEGEHGSFYERARIPVDIQFLIVHLK